MGELLALYFATSGMVHVYDDLSHLDNPIYCLPVQNGGGLAPEQFPGMPELIYIGVTFDRDGTRAKCFDRPDLIMKVHQPKELVK